MIAFVEGEIVEKHPTRVIVGVAGIGYEVFIPLSSYDRLPAKGAACRLLTHDYIREDSHQLFGFMSEAEREMFVLLLGTTGIGPKLALSALSSLSVRDIKVAVVERDVKRCIRDAGPGGGLFIDTGAGEIMPWYPIENIIALCDAVHKYGGYPITL